MQTNDTDCPIIKLPFSIYSHASIYSPLLKSTITCGGVNSSNGHTSLSSCSMLNQSGSQKAFPSMTDTRWGFAMASIENRLFAIGGICWNMLPNDACNMLETILLDEKMESKFWTLEKRIPFSVSFHCVVTVGDNIIVTGGVGYRNKVS